MVKSAIVLAVALCTCTLSTAQTRKPTKSPHPSAAAAWSQEPDAVMGIKLGAPLSETPLPKCTVGVFEESPVMCLGNPDALPGNGSAIKGSPFPGITFDVKLDTAGKVGLVIGKIDHDQFADFRDTLIARYGSPSENTTAQVQTRGGATLSDQTLRWQGKHMNITLRERVHDIDTSTVMFMDNDFLNAEVVKLRGDKARKASAL